MGVLIISAALSLTIGAHGLSVKDYPTQACSAVDRVVLGVDTAVPLSNTPVSSTCVPRANRAGQWMSALGLVEQWLYPGVWVFNHRGWLLTAGGDVASVDFLVPSGARLLMAIQRRIS